MATRLEARSLVKRFGPITAVDDISLDVAEGEVLGFLGPNGAGKTTTMKMLTGFLNPSAGEAVVCGHKVADDPQAAKACIGYLPEGAPAYGDMTPRQFLDFCADARGLNGDAKTAAVAKAAKALSLAQVLDQPIETLSKGFRRRVGLAQAILHDPKVLILDEPTDGLDPNQKHEVRRLIDGMRSDKAIIVSTHILEEVEAVCTRVVVIDRGRVVFDGTPADFKARAASRNVVHFSLPLELKQAALAALDGVDAIDRLDSDESAGRLRLKIRGKDRIRFLNRITELIAAQDWPVDDLELDPGRLDEVFRALTHTDVKEAAE